MIRATLYYRPDRVLPGELLKVLASLSKAIAKTLQTEAEPYIPEETVRLNTTPIEARDEMRSDLVLDVWVGASEHTLAKRNEIAAQINEYFKLATQSHITSVVNFYPVAMGYAEWPDRAR